jgi:hypothetical protein
MIRLELVEFRNTDLGVHESLHVTDGQTNMLTLVGDCVEHLFMKWTLPVQTISLGIISDVGLFVSFRFILLL